MQRGDRKQREALMQTKLFCEKIKWCAVSCILHQRLLRNRGASKRKTQNRNAVGRGEISFGCDKADMHVTLRRFIQQIRRSHTQRISLR